MTSKLLSTAILLSELCDLVIGEESDNTEDEYGALQPTTYAFTMAANFIVGVSVQVKDEYYFGCVATSSDGGIRIEWVTPKGEIRLIIPASQNDTPYIYYELDREYGIDQNVSPNVLAGWLDMLT